MRCVFLLLLAAVMCSAKTPTTPDKVKIAVYYESLCPDSKKFITNQLAPVWRTLRGTIKVKFVPFGKSSYQNISGQRNLTCHHGPEECAGNKIHACVLKNIRISDMDKMEIIICLMDSKSTNKTLEQCYKGSVKQQKRIRKCAEGIEGDALLDQFGTQTDAIQNPLSFVPTIVINEKFDAVLQETSFTNLHKVVCDSVVHKPAECTKKQKREI